jgi:uroporphyrinogen decarboxylase
VPPSPPHGELVFQIEKEMFGIDFDAVPKRSRFKARMDVFHRLVDEFDWAAVPGTYDAAELKKMKKAMGRSALVPAFDWVGVFSMPDGGTIMDFCVRLYEDMKGLHAEARQKCDRAIELARHAVDAGADFFVLTYDFGYNDAPFISPEHFAVLVTPYLTEIVQAIHDLGKKAILHSDGCITKLLDQLHGTGLDGYQSVDPQGHMDIREVRRQYPNWILMGNVACNMLQDTNEEKIRESVRYCMTHGGIGMPYIFSTSNCIFEGMPPASYRIIHDEYRRMATAAEQAACANR